MNLGKLRIKYEKDGNLIQLFNSVKVCSLVINGEIVDQYKGIVAPRFILNGKIALDERTIKVQAKMGFLFMTLFYDNILVKKKFMGFG